jgi:hypothetical protein
MLTACSQRCERMFDAGLESRTHVPYTFCRSRAEKKKGASMPGISEYNSLEEQIRRKCQEEGWYGPSAYKHRRVAWARPFSLTSSFAYPPATEQQLQDTEAVLGFRIPPLLRFLYAHLANGGFGPGGGIRGAIGGYGGPDTFENGNDETILKHQDVGETLVDLDSYQWHESPGQQWLKLPAGVWPRQLAPICDLGCQQEVCVDQEGQLYLWCVAEEDFDSLRKMDAFDRWIRQWLTAGE